MENRSFFKGKAVFLLLILVFGAISYGSYDVSWTFGNVGNFSYKLDAFSPSGAVLGAAIGTENPTLKLSIGKRYQVTVTNYNVHPFEVLAKGTTAGSDIVLLSMGSTVGSLESDSAISWEDNGSGTVTFTLTLGLYNSMINNNHVPGYRCRPHASLMRGDFDVLGIPLDNPIENVIEKGTVKIELEEVASGLAAPLGLRQIDDGTGRLFVNDQAGIVYTIINGQIQPTPFLDVSDRLVALGIIGTFDENDYDERGLLGFAIHPDFADLQKHGYGKVYTYTSEPVSGTADFTTNPPPANINHQSVIAEWEINSRQPNEISLSSRREIMRIDQPQFNHNGGALAFGPDGYLYISLGDGGNADDRGDGHGVSGNAQDVNTVHGSILRIDPLEPGLTANSNDLISNNGAYRVPIDNPFVGKNGVDEIFAYGFRNPFIFSFDLITGNLIAGDVGQNNIEEVDIVVKGGNYGWNLKEGKLRFNPESGTVSDDLSGLPENLVDPIVQYDHDEGISIIGGFVYSGTAIPELYGKYVFGDFSSGFQTPDGRLFYADLYTGQIKELILGLDERETNLFFKGFGQDLDGEIYLLASPNLGPYGTGGVVLKIVDLCQYRIPGDLNSDCKVDTLDFEILIEHWLEDASR